MVVPPDAVTDEAADDRETGSLDDLLDGVRDVADPISELRLRDACAERLLADVEQPLRLRVDAPDGERVGAVGDEAGEGHAHVDRDHVALLDAMTARDAVHDDVVRGDADRRRVALVAHRRGNATVRADEPVGDPVELDGRETRLDPLTDVRDRLRDERARLRDPLDLLRCLADDHAGASTSSRRSASSISA